MCVNRNRQTDQIHTMKFTKLSQWRTLLRETWPYAVSVSPSSDFSHMVEWLKLHVGTPYDAWVNDNLEYLFKCEHDAIKFSLTWS